MFEPVNRTDNHSTGTNNNYNLLCGQGTPSGVTAISDFSYRIILVVFMASEENDVEMSSFFRCSGVNGQTQFNPSTPSL